MEPYFLGYENPNPSFTNFYDNFSLDHFEYVLDGLSAFDDGGFGGVIGENQFSYSPSPAASPEKVSSNGDTSHGLLVGGVTGGANNSISPKKNVKRNAVGMMKGDDDHKLQWVAFKTKSNMDVLDDGYRWRKYGKKPVKNNPNLRNYYKCTSGGCQVKKKVERWIEDSSYVITQYKGAHTHECPS